LIRCILLCSIAALLMPLPSAGQPTPPNQGAWLFAYFKEPGNQGIDFALSRDGYHYAPLNDGQPWLAPSSPGELMRDVFVTRGPDHLFHMVWTWNWRGQSLGHATSPDLLHWSPQKEIPIMQDFPDTNNVWAPETYWDAKQHKWLLIWSSSMKNSATGHRIWFSMTPDFTSFSKPAIFFDPGYVVIDATIFRRAGTTHDPYCLIFKDQTNDPLRYQIRYATGPTLEGPWNNIQAPITEPWSEGPSAIQVGDKSIVFYDHYRPPLARYQAVETADWNHWVSADDRISMPAGSKHGSFLRISSAEAARLLERHDVAVTAR
jgi:hypothetical protein